MYINYKITTSGLLKAPKVPHAISTVHRHTHGAYVWIYFCKSRL